MLLTPGESRAWGFEAHKFIADRVIALLPPGLRELFERQRTAFVEHSIDPDLWRNVGFEDEPPRHFLDLDAYGASPFDALPRSYDEAVTKFGPEKVNAGRHAAVARRRDPRPAAADVRAARAARRTGLRASTTPCSSPR